MKPSLYLLGVCTLIALTVTVGCRAPVTCSEIVDTPLRSLSFDGLDRRTMVAWIKTNYASGDLWNVQDGPGYNWRYAGKEYSAHVVPGTPGVSVRYSANPTIAEVIQCFGKPDGYTLRSQQGAEASGTELTFWYPARGLAFRYSGFGLRGITHFTPQTPLDYVRVVRPGSMLDVAQKWYSEEYAKRVVSSTRPWPEDFGSIDYDPNFDPKP